MRHQRGFTLIELIVTIVLVAVMASMVVPYFLSGVTSSVDPINDMPTPVSLQNIAANIMADYSSNANYLNDLSLLNSQIVSGKYGLSSAHTITKSTTYKFNPGDLNDSLKVTIKDNASNRSVVMIFTKQL